MGDLSEKIKKAVELLREWETIADNHADDGTEGYFLAFSGGKDSVTCKALMDMAGVKYDAHYQLTSVDPPEQVRFIKEKHPDVIIDRPRYADGSRATMWNLIVRKKSLPTRRLRFCCEALKEDAGDGRLCVTGVRWAESANRARNQGLLTIRSNHNTNVTELTDNNDFRDTPRGGAVLINDNAESRAIVDGCVTRHKTCLNPIIDWSDQDVWDFIKGERIPYCELYDEGWDRLGCIGCPMARRRLRLMQFERWPTYKRAYMNAIEKMIQARDEGGNKPMFDTAEEWFMWWMEDPRLYGQQTLGGEEW